MFAFNFVFQSCQEFVPQIYLFIYFSLFKVDLHLNYEKPINVNSNVAYVSVNKLPNNNDNKKTKYLILRRNQQVANRLYITYMGNETLFSCFVFERFQSSIIFYCFGNKRAYFWSYLRSWYHILQNWDFYFEKRFESETKQGNSVIEFCIFRLEQLSNFNLN